MDDRTMLRRPRVTEIARSENYFEGRYKQHDIRIERDQDFHNWYIAVRGPDGCHTYDGWWRDSDGKTLDEAIIEACHGSMLLPVRAAANPAAILELVARVRELESEIEGLHGDAEDRGN